MYEVYNNPGPGFPETVYKDVLEFEFNNNFIENEKEKEYVVNYKGIILPHKFYADFVISNKVILETKGKKDIVDEDLARAINYLKVSGNKVALIVNFGEMKLHYKRVIL